MKLINLFTLIGVFILSSINIQAQNAIAQAKSFIKLEKYNKAVDILTNYYQSHPQDENAGWLLASTLHHAKSDTKSQELYKELIQKHPTNYGIKLDRINKLVERTKLNGAKKLIQTYLHGAPKEYAYKGKKLLAKINYWQGDYDRALININNALKLIQDDETAYELKEKIENLTKNRLDVNLQVFTDDQPITILTPQVRTTFYLNSKISLGGDISYPFYTIEDNNKSLPWIQGFVKYNLLKLKTNFILNGGVFIGPNSKISPTGSLVVNKKVMRYLGINVHFKYEPYTSTIIAINDPILKTNYGLALNWNNPNGFIGQIAYDNHLFSSLDNAYYTASAWLLSPPLKIKNLKLRLGYGINYSDATESSFSATKSLEEIDVEWQEGYQVEGNYNPFFSPSNQLIQTAVGLIEYKMTNKIAIQIKAGYGFSAKTDNPYLFLSKDDQGNNLIERGFNNVTFNPYDLGGSVDYIFSSNITFKGYYTFQKTNYYQSHIAGISSSILF